MISIFSFSVDRTYETPTHETYTLSAKIYGKMSLQLQNGYTLCDEEEVVVIKKISVTHIVITTNNDNDNIVDFLQKPSMPKFTKVYHIARLSSRKCFKPLTQTEKDKELDLSLLKQYQKEVTAEITKKFNL